MKEIILIMGNSSSGKSTKAKELCQSKKFRHLDLDTVAWTKSSPPTRLSIIESEALIQEFINTNTGSIIEGCYGDLIDRFLNLATELIYMDIPVEKCVLNAKNRPFESHKYSSKSAQDKNLGMLIEWIKEYESRTDSMSKSEHERLFQSFQGKKIRITI